MTGPDFSRRVFLAGLGSITAAQGLAAVRKPGGSGPFVFAYFRADDEEDQSSGLRLAVSCDGTRFESVAGGRSLLQPQVGEQKILRDPCLFRGPAPGAPFHLVWTTGWRGTTLGHATSLDLMTWSPQQAVPVMADFPGTMNVWAPEGIWHPGLKSFVLFWSSTVPALFPKVSSRPRDGLDNRIFYTTTRDFRSFSRAKVLLDPGFNVIDATFLTGRGGRLHLVVKDERLDPLEKCLRIASAASPTGPFGPLSEALTEHWTEGPTALWLGDRYRIYFDAYRAKRYGAIDSVDLRQWTPVTDLRMPIGARHGTVLPIPPSLMTRLGSAS